MDSVLGRKHRVFLLILAAWLLLANSYPPIVHAANGTKEQLHKASSQVILISVDELKGEDFASEELPIATLFSERGGAGFMHTLPQRQSQEPGIAGPLQLDSLGIKLIANDLQAAGISVYHFPQSTMYKQDALFPGGRRVRTDRLQAEIMRKMQSAPDTMGRFFLVEFNELGMVEAAKSRLDDTQYMMFRQSALSSLTLLVQELVHISGPSTLVLVVPGHKEQTALQSKQKQLQPLFAAGGDIPAHSLVSSASTRRPGIITGGDAAASVYRYLHVSQPEGLTGQPIFGTGQSENVVEELQSTWQQIQETYRRRPAVLTSYGLFAAIVLGAMAAAGAVLRRTGGRLARKIVSLLIWCGTAVLTAPLVFLSLPMKSAFTGFIWTLAAVGATAAVTYGLLQIRNLIPRIGILAVLYVGLVIGDCIAGGQLAHQSVLSYDPVVGIRFYGVGNEYMGVAVGWFLLGCACLCTISPRGRDIYRWLLPLLGMLLALFFAWPKYGANAGGTVTAAMAAAVAVIYLLKPGKVAAWGIGILFAAAPIILMLALHRHESFPTHITMADSLLQHGNFRQLQEFILGKLAMNFRLVNNYTAGIAPLVGLGVFVSIAMRPNSVVASFLAKHAAFGTFIRTGVWAALAAFLSNDSGVVAAAMILLPVLMVTGMIILAEAIPIPDTVLPTDVSLLDIPDFSFETDQSH